MMSLLRRLAPRSVRRWYHRGLATVAMFYFGRPARHLAVIGITGTDGKTTTACLTAHVLTSANRPTGLSSSATFQLGSRRWANDSHMTMPGRFALQRLLRQMVQAGCQYAVVEVSSEGLAQYRHAGIDFDVAVLTNITPEHIQSHGNFENYRRAKELLFAKIIKGGDKHLFGRVIPKVTVVNLDDANASRFLDFWAEEHYGVTLGDDRQPPANTMEKLHVLKAESIHLEANRSHFRVDGHEVTLPLAGRYNISNALEAAAICLALGVSWAEIIAGLKSFPGVPGRGQSFSSRSGWRVVVDDALTPNALEQLYRSLQQSGMKRIIGVFGAAGGGRDTWKRPELGKIAAQYCARILLTTDDPYDEDPRQITEAIKRGVPPADFQKVEVILDRREAIKRAMSLAQPGDVIAVSGMGSETSMMVKGKKVPWSDIQVVQEFLEEVDKLGKK